MYDFLKHRVVQFVRGANAAACECQPTLCRIRIARHRRQSLPGYRGLLNRIRLPGLTANCTTFAPKLVRGIEKWP